MVAVAVAPLSHPGVGVGERMTCSAFTFDTVGIGNVEPLRKRSRHDNLKPDVRLPIAIRMSAKLCGLLKKLLLCDSEDDGDMGRLEDQSCSGC